MSRKVLMKFIAISLLFASLAHAARIADFTSPSNERTNEINGMGLVYGLKGTGDGGDFQPSIRMLAEAMGHFNNKVTVNDLKAVKNVAIVFLSCKIPATGGHAGDAFDVEITSTGSASSLKGGRLFASPLTQRVSKDSEILIGTASGWVDSQDAATLTAGIIKGGCVLDEDLATGEITGGSFSFFIDRPSASWAMATRIATTINESEDNQPWAVAKSEKEVVVRIPPGEQQYPAAFISRLQQLQLTPVAAEARVVINPRNGTIVITGDVEISPVVISHKGMTISTILPAPVPTPRAPIIKETGVVALDTANTGGAKLQDLMNAMDQLKVPVADRIDIIKSLYESSKLHAKLVIE